MLSRDDSLLSLLHFVTGCSRSPPTRCCLHQDWQAENAQRTPRTSDEQECNNLVEPKMNVLWGAGYSFAKCHAERRAPMDPKVLLLIATC